MNTCDDDNFCMLDVNSWMKYRVVYGKGVLGMGDGWDYDKQLW
jgi:hypothetical protein